jgi:hypothetical protein
MKEVILVFGVLLVLIGIAVLVKPNAVFGYMGRHSKTLHIHILAVVVRLILGAALISYAAESRYPIVLEILGWISVAAAIMLAAIGRSRFMRLMDWALKLTDSFGPYAGILVIVFGGFLVYAVV